MEIYQVRSFLAVAEEASVTLAAKRLYTTPPSVSAHVKSLEDELGVSLFVRSAKGMQLTTAGRVLREKAGRLLSAAQDVAKAAAELRSQLAGGLEIGLNTDPALLRVSQLAARLRQDHPSLRLAFVALHSDAVIDGLRTGRLDAGFVYGEREVYDVELEGVTEAELVIALPAVWRLRPARMSWRELARHPWIYTHCHCPFQQRVDKEMQLRGLLCSSQVHAADDATRRELVRSGAGIAALEREAGLRLERERHARLWRPLPRLRCPLFFAYARHRKEDPSVRAARTAVSAVWRSGR